MGDIFQILIIVAIIGFAIIRKLNTKIDSETTGNAPHYPDFEENPEEETIFTPPFLTTELESTPKRNKTKYYSSRRTHTQDPIIPDQPGQETNEILSEQDFTINSTEEIRKAVIWSEILNRKY